MRELGGHDHENAAERPSQVRFIDTGLQDAEELDVVEGEQDSKHKYAGKHGSKCLPQVKERGQQGKAEAASE